ncbi:MAG: HEAT repeat domain-containing protein [Acidobacteriota bacterium]
MKSTILAAPIATFGLALLSFLSQPHGVWEVSTTDSSVPIFLELHEKSRVRVWTPSLLEPQVAASARRSGPFLRIDLPTGLSTTPGQTLAVTLGPRGTLLRARLAGAPAPAALERSRHEDLEAVIAQASRWRAERAATDHLPILATGTPGERRAAARALASAGLEIVPFVLNAVAKSDGSWNPWAVTALEGVGSEAIEPLERALFYENQQVACVAADALGRLTCRDCASQQKLRQAARAHSDARVRHAAREAVRQAPAA